MKGLIAGIYGFLSLQGDWKRWCDEARENGATGIRMFGHYSWPDGRGTRVPFARLKNLSRINDFPWNPPKAGEEARKDRYFQGEDGYVWFRHRQYPGVAVPVYDLDFFDNQYLETLEERFLYLKQVGLKIFPFELEDWCSLKHAGINKYRNPYFVSPQAHSAITPGGLFGEAIKSYMERYWQKVCDIADVTSVDIVYSIMNEYDYLGPGDAAYLSLENVRGFKDWYVKSCAYIGPPLLGSAMRHHQFILDVAGHYGIHGIITPEGYEHNIGLLLADGIDVYRKSGDIILSGDGGRDGSAPPDFKGRRGMAEKDVPFVADRIMELGFAGYEYLYRFHHGHALGNFADYDFAPLKRFAKYFGTLPPPPPAPPEPPAPPPLPTPPDPEPKKKPCSYYWNRGNIWKWIKCILGINR